MRRSAWSISLFLILVLVIIYIANAVIFDAVVTALAITSPLFLWGIGVAFALLSASFIAASTLGSRYYNWATRVYYITAATWIGLVLYLFVAALIYSAAVVIAGNPLERLGEVLLGAALLTGLYGYLHARHIVAKEVHITLPNVPAMWRGRRAVWVSDVHLGQVHGPKFAKRIVDTINTLPHDIVFIGGDLYDGTGAPDIEELAVPLGKCKAPLGIYYVTGNHEEYGDVSRFTKAIRAAGIRVLMNERVVVDGLQIVGADYATTTGRIAFAGVLAGLNMDRSAPSILLKHEPSNLDVARDAGVSLQISGHTHKAQMWPLEYMARYIYGKFAYGLNMLGDMQVFVSSGIGTWGPPMRVGTDSEVVVFVFE